MAAVKLSESTVTLIEAHVRSNIAAALSDVRTDRADSAVTTEPPQSYFRFEGAKGFRLPAIFTICDGMDLQPGDRGANHINALASVIVSVLVEDRTRDFLVTKSWRYQAALFKLLHLTSLTSVDNAVRLVSKVRRIYYSPEFSTAEDASVPAGVFRKEVALALDVEHYENF